jgi:hypothetical protein
MASGWAGTLRLNAPVTKITLSRKQQNSEPESTQLQSNSILALGQWLPRFLYGAYI